MIVSFSGLDGSGKSRTARAVTEELRRRGIDAQCSVPAYASYSAFKQRITEQLGDPYAFYGRPEAHEAVDCLVVDWLTWWSWNQHRAEAGTVLCCDRYLPDVYAQARQLGVPVDDLDRRLHRLPQADMAFLLQVDAATARHRIEARTDVQPNRSETFPWLERLAEVFTDMTKESRWRLIPLDASRPLQLSVIESVDTILLHTP
ncbi:hypothetical protein OG949_40740 (plasmid) [Streptomyces scopuliridis]|uniref:hypothetical protein n=1 Tax=Streptomyces scopuliridis TaxID=452529 RepID=UPI002DD7A5BA|nr:hypothetical protein [Streptomyces scopuliridis]WSB39083.1 hypothetical protein OG949_40740 [Streptomyces scopuliridis]